VPRIGQERQALRQEAPDDLGDRVAGRQEEDGQEPALCVGVGVGHSAEAYQSWNRGLGNTYEKVYDTWEGAMFALVLLGLFVGFLIFLPILLVLVVLRVALGLVLLPIKIVGAVAKLTIGLLVGILALVAAVLGLVLVPLLPILLVAFGTWLVLRLLRRRPVPA
jgi:hypothetical protein